MFGKVTPAFRAYLEATVCREILELLGQQDHLELLVRKVLLV
jgi:hypothetical protein